MKLSILGIFVIFGVLPYAFGPEVKAYLHRNTFANGPEAYGAIQPQIVSTVFPSITLVGLK